MFAIVNVCWDAKNFQIFVCFYRVCISQVKMEVIFLVDEQLNLINDVEVSKHKAFFRL